MAARTTGTALTSAASPVLRGPGDLGVRRWTGPSCPTCDPTPPTRSTPGSPASATLSLPSCSRPWSRRPRSPPRCCSRRARARHRAGRHGGGRARRPPQLLGPGPLGLAGPVARRPGRDEGGGLGGRQGCVQRRLPPGPRRARRPSWRSRSPARTAGCRRSPRASTPPARRPTRPTPRQPPSAWPGSGPQPATPLAPSRALDLVPSDQPRLPREPPAARRRAPRRLARRPRRPRPGADQHRVGPDGPGASGSATPCGSCATRSTSVTKGAGVPAGGPAARPSAASRPRGRPARRPGERLPGAGPRGRRPRRSRRPGQRGQRRTQPDAGVNVTEPRTCPTCGAAGSGDSNFCEECGTAARRDGPRSPAPRAATAPGRRRAAARSRTWAAGPSRARRPPGSVAAAQASAAPVALPAELRRRRRARRLLRAVRRQGAQPARPLPRAARTLGGRRLRQGHPAPPQRGRDGDERQPGRRRAGAPRGAARARRRLQHRRLAGRFAGRCQGGARRAAPCRSPTASARPEARLAAVTHVLANAVEAAQAEVVAAATAGRRQPGVGDLQRGGARGRRASATPTWATHAATGCPTALRRRPAQRRRLRRPGADRRRGAPRRGRVLAAGARDHQVARPGQRGPRPGGRAAEDHRAGLAARRARTGCGTTPPSPLQLVEQIARRRRPTTPRAGPRADRLRQRRRAGRTTSPTVARPGSRGPVTRAQCRPDHDHRRSSHMAEFAATVYQNEFLPDGGTDVNAIVTITCAGAGSGWSVRDGCGRVEHRRRDHHRRHLRIDGPRDDGGRQGRRPGRAGRDRRRHAIRRDRGHRPRLPGLSPGRGREPALVVMDAQTPRGGLRRDLELPRLRRDRDRLLARPRRHASSPRSRRSPSGTPSSSPTARTASSPRASTPPSSGRPGYFQCDCRGAGTDWKVEEMRRIAQALLGTVDIIPSPEQMREEFRAMMQHRDGARRRPTPSCGCGLRRVRRCSSSGRSSPTVEDLTDRRVPRSTPLTGGYPTGAWADESRDYHVAVRLPGQGRRPGAARRPRADRASATTSPPRAW